MVLLKGNEQLLYFHFDSIQGNNLQAAGVVATKLERVLSAQDSKNNSTTNVQVQECKTPQQANGYDCGIHVLAAAEALSVVNDEDTYETALPEWIHSKNRTTGDFAIKYRESMAVDIRQLATQYREKKSNM